MENKLLVPVSIVIAGVIVAGAIMYTNSPSANVSGTAQVDGGANNARPTIVNSDVLKVRAEDHILGDPEAKVTVIEYGDFECPFCGRLFSDAISGIKENYVKSGDVQLVYRHFPLTTIHTQAQGAAEASECAGEQGQFWPYHDILYERQSALSASSYKAWASELGLDTVQFNNCVDSNKYAKKVSDGFNEARSLGANGTPATFVNGQLVSGAQPYSAFEQLIEDALNN
jgi:protein-disulfide isomerase